MLAGSAAASVERARVRLAPPRPLAPPRLFPGAARPGPYHGPGPRLPLERAARRNLATFAAFDGPRFVSTPDLVDLVQLEYSFGQLPAVLPIETSAGEIRAGIAICFDIIFDDHAVALMNGGGDAAEVILAQTNNADFGHTDQSAQQLQIAKLRAVETGRALVNISTVGTSAVVLPNGEEVDRLTPFTAGAMVAEVPLVTGQTPALRFGSVIAGAWLALAAAGMLLGLAAGRGRRAPDSGEPR